jgi:arylsulfatase A
MDAKSKLSHILSPKRPMAHKFAPHNGNVVHTCLTTSTTKSHPARIPAMKSLVFGISLVLTGCTTTGQKTVDITRPNVVILYTDDQGYGDCGFLNPKSKFATPNLDRLAASGISFTDGHCADSVCSPSRYALLTGRYAWRTRLKRGVIGADNNCLIRQEMTLATLLKSHGYRTGIVGKWHLGLQIPGVKGKRDWSQAVTDGPLQKGFDSFYGIPASMNFGVLTWFKNNHATTPASMWTRKKFPSAQITTKPLDYRMAPPYDAQRKGGSNLEVAPSFQDAEVLRIITKKSVAFIEEAARHPQKPFFLYVPFTSPHLPHCTAAEFKGKSTMGNYGDFMLETDARVGQILDALDQHGLRDNTLVVFSSDNGPENNYHDWLRIYGHKSNGGLRGGKRDVYEGGHRVPFLVRWPAVIPTARVDKTPICQTDLLATIAEILGTNLPDDAGVDSFSFFACLQNQPRPKRAPIMHHAGTGHFAIRSGRYKLLLYRPKQRQANKKSKGPKFELYDLEADPTETRNLISKLPEVAAKLRSAATTIVQRGRSTPGPQLKNDGATWWPQLTWIPKPPR